MVSIKKKKTPEEVKRSARNSHLVRTYGITIDQYEELLKKQDYKCGVCLRHKDEFNKALAVDHNHSTGEVRGLLCQHCNQRVIGRHKEPELFRRAWQYLLKGTGYFVPQKKKERKRKKK